MSPLAERRALVLSGGGIRVAYQAGALLALSEAGIEFDHVDATSGGALNLAMLLSGRSPAEMCERWRRLDPKDFLSLSPPDRFTAGGDCVGLGDADGIVERVFPALGIDFAKVRAAARPEGTINVLEYDRKVNVVIPHRELDADLLVASMSLPILLPPVKKGGKTYLDSAFVRDANPLEAVRRGANEVWIVWCLNNTSEYRGGLLRLYVQMLEMAANGALAVDFERIAEINERRRAGEPVHGSSTPAVVHLVRPLHPLPLDPDVVLGRADLATLVDRGYADAARAIRERRPGGTPLLPEATLMTSSTSAGVTFRETMSGPFALDEAEPEAGAARGKKAGTTLAMHATVVIDDLDRFIAEPDHPGRLSGHVDFEPLGRSLPSASGVFNLFSRGPDPRTKLMVYELGFRARGEDYYLAGRKEVRDDPGLDMWKDTTTLFARLHRGRDATAPIAGAGILTLNLGRLARMIPTMTVINAGSAGAKAAALAKFGRFFAGELYESYFGGASSESE